MTPKTASPVRIKVTGRPEQYTGDADAIRAALRAGGVHPDRVRVLVPMFADTATLPPREANLALRAGVVSLDAASRPTRSPRELGTPAAQRLYDRLMERLRREVTEGVQDYNGDSNLEGVAWDLAAGVYALHARELAPLMAALGVPQRDVITALVEGALG